MKSTVAVISIGSNSDDRSQKVELAIEFLREILRDTHVSTVYESEAFNHNDKAPYTNAVVVGKTVITMETLNLSLKEFETQSGRDSTARANGIVPIDLDIVIWDGRIIRNDDFERPYFNVGYRELLSKGAFEE
ncbi:MAG: 2-amino-4-hydroxy-6-hydroxymethyldihydropteridine diphosphokinase [Muribaculaceae bacterium]|nr:2-amino-4-hydroxy-6-hydroxymethyldihydropteridine diphosphokinase [Muribaculaceae bacterium]